MLAEPRRGAADGAGGLRELRRDAGVAQRPQIRVLHRLPESGGGEVGIVGEIVRPVDGHRRDVRGVERLQPLGGSALGQQLGERCVDLVDVGEAARQGAEPRVLGQIRPVRDLEQRRPLPVGVGEGADPAVPGAVGAAARRERTRVAHRAPRRLVGLPVEMLEHVEGDQRLEHRHLDALAFAGLRAVQQGREHRHRDVQSGYLVGDDGIDVARLAVHRLERREPRDRLDHVVVGGLVSVWTRTAESPGPAVDDSRIACAHRGVVEPEPIDRPRAHVVHERVRAREEPHHGLQAAGVLQIEHDAALVAVVGEEDGPHRVVDRRRAGAAHRVPAGCFDLDHVRAQVPEHLGRDGTEQDGGEIDDPHPREGAGGFTRGFSHQYDLGSPSTRSAM